MQTYAAFLGHLPRISVAELSATIPDFALVKILERTVVVFRTSMDLEEADLDNWGGIILLAKQIKSGTKPDYDEIPSLLAAELADAKKGKVTFALRTVGAPKPKIKELYRKCKDELKRKGRSSRYVGNEMQPAATALVHDVGLLNPKEGCEIVILKGEDYFWVGKSVAAQNPHAYTKRDIAKPVRDTRSGLLPPKLAQIMLNFGWWLVEEGRGAKGDLPNTKTKSKIAPRKSHLLVFDPFCGTGVIPLECIVRGWPIIATDLSQKAVSGTEKNLEWARKTFDVKKRDVPSDVWKQDARKKFDLKQKPDVIVTESHLGPGLTERPTQKDAMKIRTELDELEREFLRNMAASFPGVPVVVTWPMWQLRTGPMFLERAWKDLKDIGYEAVLPQGVESETEDRKSLLYRRADQLVGREILLLKPLSK